MLFPADRSALFPFSVLPDAAAGALHSLLRRIQPSALSEGNEALLQAWLLQLKPPPKDLPLHLCVELHQRWLEALHRGQPKLAEQEEFRIPLTLQSPLPLTRAVLLRALLCSALNRVHHYPEIASAKDIPLSTSRSIGMAIALACCGRGMFECSHVKEARDNGIEQYAAYSAGEASLATAVLGLRQASVLGEAAPTALYRLSLAVEEWLALPAPHTPTTSAGLRYRCKAALGFWNSFSQAHCSDSALMQIPQLASFALYVGLVRPSALPLLSSWAHAGVLAVACNMALGDVASSNRTASSAGDGDLRWAFRLLHGLRQFTATGNDPSWAGRSASLEPLQRLWTTAAMHDSHRFPSSLPCRGPHHVLSHQWSATFMEKAGLLAYDETFFPSSLPQPKSLQPGLRPGTEPQCSPTSSAIRTLLGFSGTAATAPAALARTETGEEKEKEKEKTTGAAAGQNSGCGGCAHLQPPVGFLQAMELRFIAIHQVLRTCMGMSLPDEKYYCPVPAMMLCGESCRHISQCWLQLRSSLASSMPAGTAAWASGAEAADSLPMAFVAYDALHSTSSGEAKCRRCREDAQSSSTPAAPPSFSKCLCSWFFAMMQAATRLQSSVFHFLSRILSHVLKGKITAATQGALRGLSNDWTSWEMQRPTSPRPQSSTPSSPAATPTADIHDALFLEQQFPLADDAEIQSTASPAASPESSFFGSGGRGTGQRLLDGLWAVIMMAPSEEGLLALLARLRKLCVLYRNDGFAPLPTSSVASIVVSAVSCWAAAEVSYAVFLLLPWRWPTSNHSLSIFPELSMAW